MGNYYITYYTEAGNVIHKRLATATLEDVYADITLISRSVPIVKFTVEYR